MNYFIHVAKGFSRSKLIHAFLMKNGFLMVLYYFICTETGKWWCYWDEEFMEIFCLSIALTLAISFEFPRSICHKPRVFKCPFYLEVDLAWENEKAIQQATEKSTGICYLL